MNSSLIRSSTWQIVVLTYVGLILCYPVCFYTHRAAARDMDTAPTYEDWKLLRTMRRISVVGIVLTLVIFVPSILFTLYVMFSVASGS